MGFKESLVMSWIEVYCIRHLALPPHIPFGGNPMGRSEGIVGVSLYISQGRHDLISLGHDVVLVCDPLVIDS